MKKILSYVIVFLSIFIIWNCEVSASDVKYTCKYETNDGKINMSFIVKNGKVSEDDVESNSSGGSDPIVNWSKEYGGFSAAEYSKSNTCPSKALLLEADWDMEWRYYVSDDDHVESIKNKFDDDYGIDHIYKLRLVSGPQRRDDLSFDEKITFTFHVNNENSNQQSTTQTVTYSEILSGTKIQKNEFNIEGLIFTGWYSKITKKNGQIFKICGDSECINEKLIKDQSELKEAFDSFTDYESGDSINLYAQWVVAGDINPIYINEYNLGPGECVNHEYLWIETEYGGYCNVDNLQYVQCANAFDIPHQVPELTSFGINFLKIITPIILIVTSIITLVKALMASKEDEIKKATGTLKRRLIAAALVFFVIYIVQFVIMKVADSSETDDISACLSCFINNRCSNDNYSTIYYKTNLAGTYNCFYIDGKPLNGTGTCPQDK